MKEKLKKLLEQTNNIHLPIPIDERETAEYRMMRKTVLESRLLDDMESVNGWEAVTPYASIELSSDRCVAGVHCLKFSCPTNLESWGDASSHMYNPGRIYAVPAARRNFDREDWSGWNRISAWVYPVAPGMKSITLRIQLFNDGRRKVPDVYLRDGAHNMSLKGNTWNHVVLEFPYLDRDCVTAVAFEYDMVGHEPDAADHVSFFIDKLELQKVRCDTFEGWVPAGDRISFSGSGYQTGSAKVAIASDIKSDRFKLIETATGRVVLDKAIDVLKTKVGPLQVLNFSEVMEEGEYLIAAGNLTTRVFSISNDVWESSVWKVLNFFFCQRCGYEVFGKHRACHSDMLLKHGDKSIVANGGWHDAGDLAQGLLNTTEATAALLSLAGSLQGRNDALYRRVLEEAKWGLDYVLKMRFGDGYRATYSSCSIWTDGVIGTKDDITAQPGRSALMNFSAAYTEALGAKLFSSVDPDYANYALRIAREDFDFGMDILKENKETLGEDRRRAVSDFIEVLPGSLGALAASALYPLTQEERYHELAKEFGRTVTQCQQQEYTDWEIPLTGFYYTNREKKLIWHHNHFSSACMPDMAMRALCEAFPDDPDYMLWYNALVLSGEYYKKLVKFTNPYYVVPAGVYHENEALDYPEDILASHPVAEENREAILKEYGDAVRKGVELGDGYYLRVYPVWFSFRGNYNVLLSENKSMTCAAAVRNDYDLYVASQRQYEWIVGKNPMCQSTLYGEGYDYVQLYAVQPGQTVGALPVGMMSHFDNDEPYWPQVNNATYKEVWVGPATKWMWDMADNLLPARISGYVKLEENAELRFQNLRSRKVYTILPHPHTGWFELELPAGRYEMTYGQSVRSVTFISGKQYQFNGAIYSMEISTERDGDNISLTVHVRGENDLPIEIRTANLDGLDQHTLIMLKNGEGEMTFTGTILDPNKPFAGIVIPGGDMNDKIEFIDERLRH